MIDLLLGALGGVACLVIVYLAIQNVNANAFPTVEPRELAVRIIGPEGTKLRVGEEISLFIEDSEGQKAFLQNGELTEDGTLSVKWPNWLAPEGKDYLVSVGCHPDNELKIGIWLRSVSDPSDEIVDFRSSIELAVHWLDSPEKKIEYALDLSGSFFELNEVPRK